MRARPIVLGHEPLPCLHLAELPRAGDTLSLTFPDMAPLYRVRRVHWPISPDGQCEAVELHLTPAALSPEEGGEG